MSLRNIGIVYRKELTEALRDRRTLISTIVVPLLMFPVLTVGFGAAMVSLMNKAEKETPKVIILGGADSPHVLADLKKLEGLEIVDFTPDWKDRIVNKEVGAAVEIPAGFETDLGRQKSDTLRIYNYQNEIKSEFAANHVEKALKKYGDGIVKDRLAARNLEVSLLNPFEIKQENVAPPEKVGGAAIGGFLGYFVIVLCLQGAMYPAIDLTAGEKERGTMETILSSPISRVHLVLGKFFLVLTAALMTAALSVTSMGVSFWGSQKFHAFDIGGASDAGSPQLHISVSAILSVFVMALPLAVMFSAALLTIALFAKSHKEAQSYIMPLMFIVIIPAIAAMLPGVELTPKLALIPVLNVSLLCKDLIAGTYHWNLIAIIFGSTCAYAAIALFLAVKMFQRESVLFRS
ncbi:MAG TPA: ABC transporter permease [Candidatus Acidoferrum sp.]|nr:ABC transporter permease [Candidatus Acidoferrum sp.]